MAEQEQYQMIDQEGAKRTAEESHHSGGSPSNKKARGDGEEFYDRGEGPDMTLRLLIQSGSAGGIIGKGGDNIKRLRNEYNASVTVPDCNGPERVLSIQAKRGDAIGCLEDIMPLLKEGSSRRRGRDQQGSHEGECEARLLVHQSSAGAIIGRAGFKIKELRETSSAAIKVYPECCPNSQERVVQFNGQPDPVTLGIRKTLNVIHNSPIKGPIQLYDPFCFDRSDYGGHQGGGMMEGPHYGNYGPYPGDRMRGPDRRGRGPPFMGGGGMRGRSSGRPYGGGGGGGRGGGGGGGRRMNEGYDYSRDRDTENFSFEKTFEGGDEEGKNYTQVTIPKDLAGSIIGTGGERINEIRHRSGAKIKIAEALPGSNDRVITITGDEEEIMNAQYLLQTSVRKFSGKGGF